MKREPEIHVVKRDGKLYMEPVNPPEDRVGNFLKDVQQSLEEMNPMRQMAAQVDHIEQLRRERISHEARLKTEAIEREEAMVRELAAVRQALHRSEESEAVANARADAAEDQDTRNQAESGKRERFMMALTAISTVAAIVAIFVA